MHMDSSGEINHTIYAGTLVFPVMPLSQSDKEVHIFFIETRECVIY